MEAILLVGGLGTRLGNLTKNTPKPMLNIRGIPFLERLLRHLKDSGFSRVVLAVGYKKEVIEGFVENCSDDLPELILSEEELPLGTGGAIAKALKHLNSKNIFVMNGDSYLQVDFKKMEVFHNQRMSDITIASYFISPADRYGVMQVNEEFEIELFKEKGKCDQGIINGGVYILNVESLNRIFSSIKNSSFSFEDVVLANQCNKLKKFHFQTDGYFLDIGIPADFEKAQKELFI